MITDYFMITEKSNRLKVIMITDYDYPNSEHLSTKTTILSYQGLRLSTMKPSLVKMQNYIQTE